MLIGQRYEVKNKEVKGGMSQATMARDTHLERNVMIKTLQAGQEARRLLDEQKALLALRSRHVVQLLDVVDFNGSPALVLEYIEGDDLEVGKLDVDSAYLKTLWQVAAGLCDIHAQGVVHRDLKPNNIRRDVHGVIKIIDFGLSRQIGVDNRTQSAIGWLPFMAPELITATDTDFTQMVDVYAFAMTALSIAKKGIPAWANVRRLPTIPVDAVSQQLPALDGSVTAILQKCLSAQPQERPPISDVKIVLEQQLLFDRHRARISLRGNVYEINSKRRTSTPSITINGHVVAGLRVDYDGYWFTVGSVTGNVRLNNVAARAGAVMPRSCVIEFQIAQGNDVYATFDVSNPEVSL